MYMNGQQVERVLLSLQLVFALLILEGELKHEKKEAHPLVQSLLAEFEDVFPLELPSDL